MLIGQFIATARIQENNYKPGCFRHEQTGHSDVIFRVAEGVTGGMIR
jgi:hypothetical protein